MSDLTTKGVFEYTMSFVAASESYRSQFVDKWMEVIANATMEGAQANNMPGEVSPYSRSRVYRSPKARILLKDSETAKLVWTYVSKLARTIFGNRDGKYIEAEPVGYEDVAKAQAVTRLERYAFGLPGHFRTFVEGLYDMVTMGTAVIEDYWKYDEREVVVKSYASIAGVESAGTSRDTVPVYDDVCLRVVDVMDFYPDPARYRIEEMSGCAKRFRMNAFEARRMADREYYDPAAVESAISKGVGASEPTKPSFRAGYDQPAQKMSVPGFKEMNAYEYWGDFAKEAGAVDSDTGKPVTRGVATILNGEVVRTKAWPLTDPLLPFHTLIINPVQGRFYGISPAELVRFDQSFADAVKVLLAEAIIRQVHPPIAVDDMSEIDVAALRAWKADTIVAVRGGPNSVGTLRYDADVTAGFNLLQGLKSEIQGGSGALGAIQGEAGPDREAASVGVQRIQMALDRPELAGMVLESECLPPIAKAILKRYQQFLDGTDDLKKRIGELPDPFWIGDILGDFDIRFVGSRNVMSNQEKLQAFDRLVSYSQAVPAAQAYLPHPDVMQMIVGELMGLPEAAAQVGNPQQMMLNAGLTGLMSRLGQPQGGPQQNGVPNAPEPAGMMPGQAAGAPIS